ncbi:MAG: hypothetical protein IJ325_13530 [Clostridia bacterium]|nr:hypothetical protein [Clostridia bacterium]
MHLTVRDMCCARDMPAARYVLRDTGDQIEKTVPPSRFPLHFAKQNISRRRHIAFAKQIYRTLQAYIAKNHMNNTTKNQTPNKKSPQFQSFLKRGRGTEELLRKSSGGRKTFSQKVFLPPLQKIT